MCNQVDDLKSSLAKCIFKEKNKILTHILPNQQLNFKADRMQESFCTSGFLSLPLFILICFLIKKVVAFVLFIDLITYYNDFTLLEESSNKQTDLLLLLHLLYAHKA
ncbi:hypothetical protein T07_6393 [Trichinella nelsoni]|uniref:Uncharacterized protein n=1 Tax=Trichinella nelsoni TaxID=6336 RepID=A0A0V0RTQ9_9BILA|nr:hypothetical protein T07_6393 [Trichinella nelsoni]